jgi:MoaA/NifB/PqqE/SkfB family radical SAM enzyme
LKNNIEKPDRIKNDLFYENSAVNRIEIMQDLAKIKSRPKAIHVTLTYKCNMKCRFCYQHHFQNQWSLPSGSCEQIMKLFPYLQNFVWQGGEAYLHPNFEKMLLKSTEFPNMQQTLITNGMFINEKWIEIFSRIHDFHLVIPVESVQKEVYENLRAGGSFELLKKNIGLLRKAMKNNKNKLRISLNTILMKCNYREIKDIADFAIENGFSHIIMTPLYQNGAEFFEKEYISPQDKDVRIYLSTVMPGIRDKCAKNKVSITDRFSIAEPGPVEPCLGNNKPVCFAPWQQLYIECDGRVRANCYCTQDLGNVNNSSIEEIWNSSVSISIRESISKGDFSLCNPICRENLVESDLALK